MALVLVLACAREAVRGDLATTYGALFNDHVEITFPNAPDKSHALSDFPLLVRLAENEPAGFSYARTDDYGEDIRFLSVESGVTNAVPYEVDTWDKSGESLLWVRVPKLGQEPKGGRRLIMYWAPDSSSALPANDSRAVWDGYSAVWHMNGKTTDSTTNGVSATKGPAALSRAGRLGLALGTRSETASGPILQVPSGTAVDRMAQDAYTVTGWMKVNALTGTPWLYSARASATDDAFGAELVAKDDGVALKLHADASTADGPGTRHFATNEWVHVAVVHAAQDGKHTVYVNGVEFYGPENARTDKAGTQGFALGGLIGSTAAGTLNGDLDDVRIYPGVQTKAWFTNEYAQAVSADYLAFGTVSSTGKSVYEGGDESGQGNYSPDDYAGQAVFVPDGVEDGAILTNFVSLITVWEGEPQGFDPKTLPFGTEDIRFFSDLGEVLDYDLEYWNANGRSYFWVKVPKLRSSSRIKMCWGLKEGASLPSNDVASVWSDYAGVWHMTDEHDATANNATGAFGPKAVQQLGRAGLAAGTQVTKQNGAILDVESNAAIDALPAGPFTVTGWALVNSTTLRYGALFSRGSEATEAWGAQFCGGTAGDSSAIAVQTGSSSLTNAVSVGVETWFRFDFVYDADRLAIYINGVETASSAEKRTILNGTRGRLSIGGLVSAAEGALGANTFNGFIDEFRLRPGTLSDAERTADYSQTAGDAFYTRQPASWDDEAILQNRWRVYPSLSKTEWREGEEPAEFILGTPWYGDEQTISFRNRSTGEDVTNGVPTTVGDYTAIFTVAESKPYSSLTYAINFRILAYRPSHDLGDGNDRILLLNDDESVSDGLVRAQAYNDTVAGLGRPYWVHDADSGYDYTSTSLLYNFCGGLRHTYWSYDGQTRLWDLLDVRYGNTYNNADEVYWQTGGWEEWDEGLNDDQNYLPWNPDGGCLVDFGYTAGGWHEYAAQAVLCNTERASINSTLYTNGIGTIYFDCVNSHTDDATNGYYRLVVEVATNALTHSAENPQPVGIPTDEAIAATHKEYDEELGEDVSVVHDSYKWADWKRVTMSVTLVNDGTMTDLGLTDELTLDLTRGGSYTRFYRIHVPLDIACEARFRIRRSAINPNYTVSPDVRSLVLVDNVICSKPRNSVKVVPRGHYDPTKVKRETVGYEGAFTPSYPSIADEKLTARAILVRSMASGAISSVTMHYRWRYLDQQSTDWMTVGLDPVTLTSFEPLVWPRLSGDIEYWYEVGQSDIFYQYADYSGLDLGLPGYSEEITGVTNRAPTYATHGLDWFTRIRDGKSDYGEIKLFVRRGKTAAVEPVEMFVARNQIWRGCLQTTNAIADGVYFRFEGRNRQDDEQADFQFNTNCWYLTDTVQSLPVTSVLTGGTTNDWGWVPCDGATGHILFQFDESARALTVVHADWQDFNKWDDAHGDYFSGSSTDDASKKGSSSAKNEYLRSYADWEDDVATNKNWNESFSPGSVSGFTPYAWFRSGRSPNGFDVGEGMWVYQAYAFPGEDAKDPQLAYQMAGQGRGSIKPALSSAKMPRGIESVSFNARLAQTVSPDQFAYYGEGLSLTNYSFVTRAAFDLNANSNFTGNASLSLMAFYTPNEGCYEARWEQIGGLIEDGSGTILGPTARSQRLVLYRWRYSRQTWTATEVYAATNTDSVCNWYSGKSPRGIPLTTSITNNLMPFYIGACDNKSAGYTVVIAGVRIAGGTDVRENQRGGVTANDSFKNGLNTAGWLYIVYRDNRSDRLTSGTYGLLASNCEGVFVRPQYHKDIVSWKSKVADTQALPTQRYPVSNVDSVANFIEANATNCAPGMRGIGKWIQNSGRIGAFSATPYDNYNGFTNQTVSQTVEVFTKPYGSDDANWTNVASRPLTGFGKPGILRDTEVTLWDADQLDVKVAAGGTLDDVRTDVVIDNLQIAQWRGQDWLGFDEDEQEDFGPSNFVYTSGWIKDGALQLSPRRTKDDYPCSLRVPLCDGRRNADKKTYRGIGLGSLSISYRNAQSNACLLVQIATNGVSYLNLDEYTLDDGTTDDYWVTVTNWDFSVMSEEDRAEGKLSCSFGLHDIVGTARILVDPTLRARVRDTDDPTAFGSVDIVQALFRDEPPLDKGCWWGFNIRTFGGVEDVEQRMYLPDNPMRRILPPLDEYGMSFALNNSVTDQCDPDAIARAEAAGEDNPFRAHMPFLQTPTFRNNVVGEVSFRARKYSIYQGAQDAEVTLYGTRRTDLDLMKDTDWDKLNVFIVSNTTYETYRYKTDTSDGYKVFRFAVTGVRGVADPGDKPVCGDEPVRVLLDDVLVSEAIRARLAFRNVGAFRHDIAKTTYVTNVPSVSEQPIAGEGWGVQAEVYSAMLGDEVDSETPPRVRLHYYKGRSPWGFSQWKSQGTSAWLTKATDTNNFYRSSTSDSPAAVIPMTSSDWEIVQYMLEVVYAVINPETGQRSTATNWLESADWQIPSWYYPVDYNAKYGEDRADRFAAYSIVDTIAPGWAWINEINIFGMFDENYDNTDVQRQFVEVAKPVESSLEGWSLRMLAAVNSKSIDTAIITNEVAVFGLGVSAEKASPSAYNMSFVVVGNPVTTLSRSKGEYDGAWSFSNVDYEPFNRESGNDYLSGWEPVAIQLVRPSGVIEHEVAVLGTNDWGEAKKWSHSSSNLVSILTTQNPSAQFFALPDDDYAPTKSVGVFDSRGEASKWWNNTMKLTPGNLNENQVINPDHPTPGGELILVFAEVDTVFGHILQTVGEGTNTTARQTISLKSGNEAGLDISYTVAPWCELGTVKETEDGTARTPVISTVGPRQYKVNVAKGATRNVTVVASAAIDSKLREYGLDENNRYTPAILHWLECHKLADGVTDFYDWASGEIHLAQFLALSGERQRDMTLTEMYWLDMDPTASNMFFRAGMVRPPAQVVWKDPTYDAERDPKAYTNLRMGVYMSISNGNGHAAHDGKSVWAPYVLRGLGEGELSWDYSPSSKTSGAWTSETFKVTGYLDNGLTSVSDAAAWIPLRYFVFGKNSFDANFESEIDVDDPFSTRSPAYSQGWYRYAQEHGKQPPVFLSWNIDERLQPITAEILAPTNRLDGTQSP